MPARKKVVKKSKPSAKSHPKVHPPRAPPAQSALTGGSVGSTIGGMVGGAPGAALGNVLGSVGQMLYNKITGHGDYKVAENTLVNAGTSVPVFAANGNRRTIIRHREYIQDISGSIAFNISKFPINPGMALTHPWLSSVAGNYEQYKLLGMVFQFKSSSATALNSTNTAMGTVIMGTEYNAVLPPFVTKSQMENHEYSMSCKPSEDMLHPIECAASETQSTVKYIRSGSIPVNADLRLYDQGNFYIATQGMQAAANIGELWCTYEYELLKPDLDLSIQGASHFVIPTAAISGVELFGNAINVPLVGVNGSSISATAGPLVNQLIFDDSLAPGIYKFDYSCIGSSTLLTNAMVPGSTGSRVSYLNFFNNDTVSSIRQAAGTTATTQFCSLMFRVLPPDGTLGSVWFQFSSTTTVPAAVAACDLFISAYNNITA